MIEQLTDELAGGKSFSDIAVLYRTNAQSRNIEEHMIKNNIPYKIVGGFRFYSRKEVKDIVAYLRVIHNPKDSVSWERVINTPPRGIGKMAQADLKKDGWRLDALEIKTGLPIQKWIAKKEELATLELMDDVLEKTKYLEWLDDGTDENIYRVENIKELRSVASMFPKLADFLENVALIESTDKPSNSNFNAITLMTIHASKGLEFPIVFLVGMEEGLFPHSRSMMELQELEEERRLCYVAVTRAMERLYLTLSSSRLYFGRQEANMPSRFLEEIPEELLDRRGSPIRKNSISAQVEDFLDELESDRHNFSW